MHLPDEATILAALPALLRIAPLTQAGQKMVYRGVHTDLGDVAVKIILNSGADERFHREIEAVTRSQFSNVPQIYESGLITHSGGDTLYLLEQFVEGETLRRLLDRQGLLSIRALVLLLEQLLTTAVEMESQLLVHRDIKPENIMIDQNGGFWLLDFGIARHLDKHSLTGAGAFGPSTAGYAPPEQFSNLKRQIDGRADLFAIGVVAYECLTGSHPFRTGAQGSIDAYRQTLTLVPPPLSIQGDSQKQLSGFIATLMQKQASRRPQSASQAKEWFDSLLPTVRIPPTRWP